MARVNLYYNYFVPKNPVRAAEVLSCLAVALSDPVFERVILLAVPGPDVPGHSKCEIWPASARPLIADYFAAAGEVSAEDDLNVVINSDCFLDPRTSHRIHLVKADEACCLSRRELASLLPFRVNRSLTRQLRPVRYAMQDCWIFRGKPRPGMVLDYPLGRLGCDNRLAYEFQAAGYRLKDRYRQLALLHYHVSQERNWSSGDRVPPPYAFPEKPLDQRCFDRVAGLVASVARKFGKAQECGAVDYISVLEAAKAVRDSDPESGAGAVERATNSVE